MFLCRGWQIEFGLEGRRCSQPVVPSRPLRDNPTFTCWFTIHLPTSWATYPAGLPPSFLSLEPPTSDTARLLSPWTICPVEPGCLLSDCGGGVPLWDRLMQNLHFSSVVWNHWICVAVRSLCAFVPIRKRTGLCHSCDRLTKKKTPICSVPMISRDIVWLWNFIFVPNIHWVETTQFRNKNNN